MEKMDEFFTARVNIYDEHMLEEVEGCAEAYIKMAQLLPENSKTLLDLGCGTGLELDQIFKKFPALAVTGIDLTRAMLDRLKQKHPSKQLRLLCGNYFEVDLGKSTYDCAVSFQTMHHFAKEEKVNLYHRIWEVLKEDGLYIECDYMVEEQAEEDLYYAENARLRKELNIREDEFYHYDTPCTVKNQLSMFETAGFSKAEKVFRVENTTIIVAYK